VVCFVLFCSAVPGKFVFYFLCSGNSFSVFRRSVFMVSEQAADPASVQLAELQNVFQEAL
jgi:hypothetical protein